MLACTAVITACAGPFDATPPVDVSIEAQPGIKPSLGPAARGSASHVVQVEPPPLVFEAAPDDLPWPDEPLDEPLMMLVCADWVTACLAFDRGAVARDREVRALAASFRALRVDVTEPGPDHDALLQRLEVSTMPVIVVTGCRERPHRRAIRELDATTLASELSSCLARER